MSAPKMSDVINKCAIYDTGDKTYGEYVRDKAEYDAYMSTPADVRAVENDGYEVEAPEKPSINEPLAGLRIISVDVSEPTKITRSPIETGVMVSDARVMMPQTITIRGICDNVRGELGVSGDYDKYGKYKNEYSGIGIGIDKTVVDVIDRFLPHTIFASQDIKPIAKKVYENIRGMYNQKGKANKKTYTISTKGNIYTDMMLSDVKQLNDAEHLMVIPVTLVFEQMIFGDSKDEETVTINPQDTTLTMNGSSQQGSILEGAAYYLAQMTGIDIGGVIK